MDVICSIEKQLLDCEYPYRWQQKRPKPEYSDFIDSLTVSLLQDTLVEDHPFSYLIIYVVLAYEHGLLEETEKAIEVSRAGETKFNEISLENGIARNFSPAFLHILKSTEVFLLKQKGDTSLALEVLSEISPISEMNVDNKAAAQHGFRALFLACYGDNEAKKAVDCLNEAIKMNPTESLWYYVKAVIIKHFVAHDPFFYRTFNIEEEFECLNEALKNKRSSLYTSLASMMYHAAAKACYHYKIKGVNSADIRELNDESMNLVKESLQLNSNCSETLFRCAEEFRRLPRPYRDVNETKRLLDEGLKLSPRSGYGNLLISRYYRMMGEPRKALAHLEICVERKVYFAFISQTCVKLELDEKVDVVQCLENMLAIFMYHWDQVRILYELVYYSTFGLQDLRKTCEYATRLMELGKCSSSYLQHDPPMEVKLLEFLKNRWPKLDKPLYELLMDQMKALEREKLSPEDQNYYNDFRNLLALRKDENAKMFHINYDQYMYKLAQRLLSTKMSANSLKGLGTQTTGRSYPIISYNRIPDTNRWIRSSSTTNASRQPPPLSWRSRGPTIHKISSVEETSAGRQSTDSLQRDSLDVECEKGSTIAGQPRKDTEKGDVVFAMRKVKIEDRGSTDEKPSLQHDSETKQTK